MKICISLLSIMLYFWFPNNPALSQNVQFTEVAEASGLWDSSVFELFDRALQSVWVDFDQDGDLDLFFTNGLQNDLFQNRGDGTFVSIIHGTGLEDSSNTYLGSTWGDMDNDGLIDVYFKTGADFRLQLYRNLDNNFFEDVTLNSGLQFDGGVEDATWMDYNNDGFLDLFVANRRSQTLIFQNNTDGTFVNMTNASGIEADNSTNVNLSWADYDNDGDLDLYVAREQGFSPVPSTLYRLENDGRFIDVGQEAGVKSVGLASVGVWGDYDSDGFVDLFLARINATNLLFRNIGDGTFEEVSVVAGVDDRLATRSACWVDVNNDGWLDLHIVNFNFHGNDPAPDRLYLNNGDGTFQDITQEAGIDEPHTGPHAVWGDYDRDGDMDLFLSHHHFDSQTNEFVSNFLLRNETINNWLEVNLEAADNRSPVGTKVSVYTNQNILKREATNGSIQAPQIANRLLFGLEQKSMVDSIVILWRSGQKESLSSIDANSVLIAREGQGIVTSVKRLDKIPEVFVLSQNYPNPFNPITAIEYQVGIAGPVHIAVYNLQGQLIQVLADEFKPAGEHKVVWNGKNSKGVNVSSGIYIYRLRLREKVASKKMILLR